MQTRVEALKMQVEQDTRCDADFDFDVRGSTIGEFVESRVWPAARVHGMSEPHLTTHVR
jgi:hypothetical protein